MFTRKVNPEIKIKRGAAKEQINLKIGFTLSCSKRAGAAFATIIIRIAIDLAMSNSTNLTLVTLLTEPSELQVQRTILER